MKIATYYIRLLFFWMLFFFTQRALFLLLNASFSKVGFLAIVWCNIKALPMDLSASFYLISIAILVGIAGMFIQNTRIIDSIVKIQSILFIFICSFICASDLGIYKVWGTKVNAKALSYLAYPKEVLPTLFAKENIGLLLIIASQIVLFIYLFKKIYRPYTKPTFALLYRAILSLILIACFIIGIRGGLQRVPINRNWVFFSPHAELNFATLNGFWNLADIAFHPINNQKNPYQYFPSAKAQNLVAEMHTIGNDSTQHILTTERPNIVIIMLESWAADVVECIGGEKNVTPKFCELANEGLLFNRFYSTGSRTEQGMLAILSAYPAQPISSIIQEFGKFDKLPNLYRVFNDQGYSTSYYAGGRLQFDNIESYLNAAGVQRMVGEDQYEIKKRTFWGAYDDEIYAKQLTDLETEKEPFFSTLSTLVTHEWFDANVPKVFTTDADPVNDNYRNTMHYADSCLYAYIQLCKTKPWYKNTLFVLVADHSCMFPKGRNNFEPERHHIPMMLVGGALKEEYKGKVSDMISSHIDISATLLAQMNLPSNQFPRSKNMFNASAPKFAYYAFDNGFGLIHPSNELVFDHNQMKTVIEKNSADTSLLKLLNYGKAYLQTNFQENLDYAEIKRK